MDKNQLLKHLTSPDSRTASIALVGLDCYPSEETATAVIDFMRTAPLPMQQIAAVTLGRLGDAGKAHIEQILGASDSDDLIEYALLGYEFVVAPRKELVIAHLQSKNYKVVQSAAIVFGKLWPAEVVETLGPLFGHSHDAIRCHVLPYVFVDTVLPEAINHLTFVYRRLHEHGREHILDAVKRGIRKYPDLMTKTVVIPVTLLAENEHEGQIEELTHMLDSDIEIERWRAAHEIVMLPIESVHDLLVKMLASPDVIVVRRALAYVLDNDPNEFINHIFALLDHDNPEVRVRAAVGLVGLDIHESTIARLLSD